MNRSPFVRVPAALFAVALIAACGESAGPDPNRVTSVSVAPANPVLFIGDDVQLQATALNSQGDPVTGRTFTWTSNAESVATVTNGRVTGVSSGQAQITATVDNVAGSTTVTVNAVEGAPSITGVTPSPLVPGATATLTGTGLTGSSEVYVSGARAHVTGTSAESIQFTVPCVAPGAAAVMARNDAGDSNGFATSVDATPSEPFSVGEFRTLSGLPCLQFAAASSETYLIGVQSVTENGAQLTQVTFGIDAEAGTTTARSERLFQTSPVRAAHQPIRIADVDQARLIAHREAEIDLRARDLASTAHLIGAARAAARSGVATYRTNTLAAAVPSVGDLVEMRYPDTSGNLCTDYIPVTGTVRHVSNRAIFVADTANPAGGFSGTDYVRFGRIFDDSIYGPQVTYFGEPTDMDDNERIIVLLTKEVNRRGNVLGFVASADFFPRTECPSSEEGEVYYSRVPDPNGDFGTEYPVQTARLHVPALIAHEMTHIIQFGRRLEFSDALDWQSIWEMESQATLAEEVIGHRYRNLDTGQNYDFDIAWENCGQNPTGIGWYCSLFTDLALYYGFQSQTERTPTAPEQCTFVARPDDTPGVPCQNGRQPYTGWSFLRWLSDHYGDALGGEGSLHSQMIVHSSSGFASIANIVGESIDELLGRWAATLYMDGRYSSVSGRLTLPSWDLYDIEQHLVETARLQPYLHNFVGSSRNVTVRGGSSAYFLVSGPRGTAAAIRASVQTGGPLPANGRMWVARVQ